jgi:hypothetical protein
MFFRRKPDAASSPRADPLRIAVLEHDLLGVQPEPGTAAAFAVNLAASGKRLREAMAKPVDPDACPHEDVAETTMLSQTRRAGICCKCGAEMVEDDAGDWVRP